MDHNLENAIKLIGGEQLFNAIETVRQALVAAYERGFDEGWDVGYDTADDVVTLLTDAQPSDAGLEAALEDL